MARRKSIVINRAHRFIADTHVGHQLMVSERVENSVLVRPRFRPFATIEEHDEHVVQMWNAVVRKSDTVYHLGDVFFWKMPLDKMAAIFKRLNGRKHLIVGNHDTSDVTDALGWESVSHGPVHFKDAATGRKLVASHHPQREWDAWWNGAVHIHGHTHANLPSSRRSLDVGVDNVGYMPLTAAEIFERMELLPELDFRGVPTEPFVPDRGRDEQPTSDDTGYRG